MQLDGNEPHGQRLARHDVVMSSSPEEVVEDDNDGDDDTDVKREEKRGESRGYILCGMRVGAMP